MSYLDELSSNTIIPLDINIKDSDINTNSKAYARIISNTNEELVIRLLNDIKNDEIIIAKNSLIVLKPPSYTLIYYDNDDDVYEITIIFDIKSWLLKSDIVQERITYLKLLKPLDIINISIYDIKSNKIYQTTATIEDISDNLEYIGLVINNNINNINFDDIVYVLKATINMLYYTAEYKIVNNIPIEITINNIENNTDLSIIFNVDEYINSYKEQLNNLITNSLSEFNVYNPISIVKEYM